MYGYSTYTCVYVYTTSQMFTEAYTQSTKPTPTSLFQIDEAYAPANRDLKLSREDCLMWFCQVIRRLVHYSNSLGAPICFQLSIT